MPSLLESDLKQRVLEENRRLHALENARYLDRHPEQTNRYQQRILRQTLSEWDRLLARPQAQLLEAGCGTGYLYLPLLQRGYRMTGVDLSDTLIQVLQNRIPDRHRGRSRLVAADIEAFLKEETSDYDGVICSALLHHLYDYETVLAELARRVRPGGLLLIFFEPLRQTIRSPFRFFLHRRLAGLDERLYTRSMKRRGIPLIEDGGMADYQRRFGGLCPDRLAAVVRENGMTVLRTTTYCVRRHAWAAWLANQVLGTRNTFNLLARKTQAAGA